VVKNLLITGAAGFIGSALTKALISEYRVLATDRAAPTGIPTKLTWVTHDLAERSALSSNIEQFCEQHGPIHAVIHLAAFYHFGTRWLDPYQTTNIDATRWLLEHCPDWGVKRFIFTSSILATPPREGRTDETTPPDDYIPYARSKAVGEGLVREHSDLVPGLILRLGGVFSDWCELPPLYSLLDMWSQHSWTGRVVAGKGLTATPYIHVDDLIQAIARCLERDTCFDPVETLILSEQGCTSHLELFESIKHSLNREPRPLFVAKPYAMNGLRVKRFLARFGGAPVFEQTWMFQFLDQPWCVENSRTRRKIGQIVTPERRLPARVSVLLQNRAQHRGEWNRRQTSRLNLALRSFPCAS